MTNVVAAAAVRSRSGEATYDRIIAAATKLFIEQGDDATAVSQIAKSAGDVTSALYCHSGSKEGGNSIAVRQGYVAFLDEPFAQAVGDFRDGSVSAIRPGVVN